MIYRRCGRCGKRIPAGSRCGCLKQRHAEYDRYTRDRKAVTFYHSAEWGLMRERILALDGGMDVYAYMTVGEIIRADTVHHIIPLRDDWARRFDDANLMSLSHESHSRIEQAYRERKAEMIPELQTMLRRFREQNR